MNNSAREVQQAAGLAAGVLAARRLGGRFVMRVAGGLAFPETAAVGVALARFVVLAVGLADPGGAVGLLVVDGPPLLGRGVLLGPLNLCTLGLRNGVPAKLPINPDSGPTLMRGLLR